MGWRDRNPLRKMYDAMLPDHVRYEELILPAKRLRTGGREFKDNAYFVQSGRIETERLANWFGLTRGVTLLDVGCGFGRLAIGLLSSAREVSYVGVDVSPVAVKWCRRYIEAAHPDFHFMHLDMENARYNPGGKPIAEGFRFPFLDGQFDIAYLYSVFSHMLQDDVGIYLMELRRLLRPGGHMFFTAFAEENVPEVSVNPPEYGPIQWESALHCVRYDLGFLERLLTSSGFEIVGFEHGEETEGQSGFYVTAGSGRID